MKRILLTVTNDLTYDQRMQRIGTTLAQNGYEVQLIGRELPHSIPLQPMPFEQARLRCRFRRGVLFYAEYNWRLCLLLLRARYDAVCSIDLDTLPAGCLATLIRRKKRVFDAHEHFTEVPEVTDRPLVKGVWATLARLCLRFYRHAYTVGPALAELFSRTYGIPFAVVRNMPDSIPAPAPAVSSRRILLYQGALNAGRGIEYLLEAMQGLEGVELWLAGEGDLSAELRRQAVTLGVQDKTRFWGFQTPDELRNLTRQAWLGLNVLENKGLSYYYSLANKYFDYVQAEVPVLTMNFPEYRALQEQHPVAVLLERLDTESLVSTVRQLLAEPDRYEQLKQATRSARLEWTWDREKETLLRVWQQVFSRPG